MITYDAVVIGLGVMGSAALRSLAARGLRVLGIDRHRPPHALGSSHGRARMIREAYFEHPLYVPLVRHAYDLWGRLEQESGKDLLRLTGGAFIGGEDSDLVSGALESSRLHGISIDVVDGAELARLFPAFARQPGIRAVIERRAGYLSPDRCMEALLERAAASGAESLVAEVIGWGSEGGRLKVTTDDGDHLTDSLVLAAGPWLPGLANKWRLPLTIERVVQAAFATARPEDHTEESLPVFAWEFEPGRIFYGFPAIDGAVKVGLHHGAPVSDPDSASREVTAADTDEVGALVRKFLPGVNGPPVEADICFYTKTPDGHFLVDRLPGLDHVLLVSACSGHGFKFAPAIGEIVADLLVTDTSDFDLSPFSLGRFEGI
ncbi:MAG: N-methyl-L-tryptophan oxidase [Gemmatimonadales bacterium]|jgi:sarcosine oxidase